MLDLLELAQLSSRPDSPTVHQRPADISDRLIETDHAPPSANVLVAPNHQLDPKLVIGSKIDRKLVLSVQIMGCDHIVGPGIAVHGMVFEIG